MTPKDKQHDKQKDFLRPELLDLIDPRHELVQLSQRIDWAELERHCQRFYSTNNGRPGSSPRLMIGLTLLKHIHALSDELCIARWVENPYWQHFCGEQYFQHRPPIDPTTLGRFRRRLGDSGLEVLMKMTVRLGLELNIIDETSCKTLVADTTVMEKAIAYPTDSQLFKRVQEQLVMLAKAQGISLRQSYEKELTDLKHKAAGYAHARQFKRLKKTLKKMATLVGRLTRDILRKLPATEQSRLILEKAAQASQLIKQTRPGWEGPKLYSLHEPEVQCIAKGKSRQRYEFGQKVAVVTTANSHFITACYCVPDNPYDGHTLYWNLIQSWLNTGVKPQEILVDRGYRGAQHDGRIAAVNVCISHQKQGRGKAHPDQSKRNGIEPIIGHMKSDGLMNRNWLKGITGDYIHALLCGVGQNLRKILRRLRSFFALIFWALSGGVNGSYLSIFEQDQTQEWAT